jgi:hypothetical protein
MEPGQGFALGVVVGVGVDLQGDGQPGVAEDDLRVAGRDGEVFQERGDGVPDVVDGDHADVVLLADAAEGADEVPRLDRSARAAGEDQVGAGPGRARAEAVAGLLGELCLECLAGEAEERQVALSGPGF